MPDFLEPPVTNLPAQPARARCRRYAAGHTPHHIQVRLCHESPPDDWRRIVVMDVAGNGVVLAVDDELRRFRNHEAGYLGACLTSVGAEGLFNVRYRLLFLRPWPDGARSVFCLQDHDEEPRPCAAA